VKQLREEEKNIIIIKVPKVQQESKITRKFIKEKVDIKNMDNEIKKKK